MAWTWRLAVLAGGVLLLLLALRQIPVLTASFVGALLLTALLHPLARRLGGDRHPRLAGAGVLLAFLVLVAVALATLGNAVVSQVTEAQSALAIGSDELLRTLKEAGLPVTEERLARLRGQVLSALQPGDGSAVSRALTAFGTVVDVASGLLLALFITLVLLLDGRTVWQWVLHVLPARAQSPTDEAGQQAFAAVSAWTGGILVIALTDAALIALALWLIGVPSVAPLAALTFLGAFLPYVGAAIAGLAAVAVALAAVGPTAALLVVAAVLLVQTLDGYVLQPLVIGKAVQLHPLAVVLAITVGGALAGILGAVVAVPLTGALSRGVSSLARGRPAAVEVPPESARNG